MSRQYIGWALGGLVLLLSFLGTAFGDTEKKPPPPKTPANARAAHHPAVQVQRLIYVVKYGSAKDLAATLGNYFQADAEIQAASNSLGDYLLIRAPDPVAKEVVRVLEQLDRRPKVVSIEVVLVEVAPRKGEGAQPDAANKELDSREFSGEAGEVMARVESLRKEGRVVSLRRLQITTVENQSASIRIGENQPIVTGSTSLGSGRTSRMINYHNTGLMVEVLPRLAPDQVVAVNLKVEDAGLRVPEKGVPLGEEDQGGATMAAEITSTTLNTCLSIPSGQAAAATGLKTTGQSGTGQTWIIVVPRVLEGEAHHGSH